MTTASVIPNYFPAPDQCSGEPLISMIDIVKTFKNAAGEFTALKAVSACFYPGEFVSVVGKSGSGKSTLVNMITGIDHPTSGTVRVDDTYVHNLSENDMSVWRGKNLGIVFQFFQLLPTLTLLENVMLPMYLSGLYAPAAREGRALDLLKLVGLESFAEKLPAAVSGGQQQSAAIARALANDPPILIADEPTGNLDSRTADEVFDLFAALIDQGKSILMVTHDIGLAARTMRTMLISDGELISPWVANALHGLSHSPMLWLTHHLQTRTQSAGEPVRLDTSGADWMLLVTAGCLELSASGETDGDSPLTGLGEGNLLTSFDLQAGGLDQVALRAGGPEPLDFLVGSGQEFAQGLSAMPALRQYLQERALSALPGWQREAGA
jgi:putative ABC transport system ATP-binding protein